MPPEITRDGLPTLLRYLALSAADNGQENVGRVRLTKLLYLTEVEFAREYGRRLTDLDWVFYHYGPYVMGIEDEFKRLPFAEAEADGFRGWVIRQWETDELDKMKLPASVERLAKRVSRRWATERLGRILDSVYYDTEPMMRAERGQHLDFGTVERAQRPYRPAENVSTALRERLAAVKSPFARPDGISVAASVAEPLEDVADLHSIDLAELQSVINDE